MPLSTTMRIQHCLDRIRAGDPGAKAELIDCACDRLRLLTRRMLGRYERLRRYEETDDVLQNAMVRLFRALEAVPIETTTEFLRLATVNIRRELLDMVRHYYGPMGQGKNVAPESEALLETRASGGGTAWGSGPYDLAVWTEFHAQAESLPEELRDVFELIWYQGLTQDEVAVLLNCSVRTVKRRWLAARLQMCDSLGMEMDRA